MKELKCKKCGCVIPMGAGFFNFPSGAQCSKCGDIHSKKLDKEFAKDPFKLIAAYLTKQ